MSPRLGVVYAIWLGMNVPASCTRRIGDRASAPVILTSGASLCGSLVMFWQSQALCLDRVGGLGGVSEGITR